MRRTFFRAWDAKTGKMITDKVEAETNKFTNTTLVTNHGVLYITTTKAGTKVELDTKHIVIMQFTGLKDKNGKEIFEGDIVFVRPFIDFKKYGIIKFVDGAFRVVWVLKAHGLNKNGEYLTFDSDVVEWEYIKRVFGEDILGDVSSKIEVIGNIYENPELVDIVESGKIGLLEGDMDGKRSDC